MVDNNSETFKDIKALQSSILVLSQKIKYLVHNEKILGRNILILNKKIPTGDFNANGSASSTQVNEILTKLDSLESRVKSIESNLELFTKRFARAEDIKEMKYIIDNINPLEYVTVEQAKKLIKESKQ